MNLNPDRLIYPVFVKDGIETKEQIKSLPGQYRHGIAGLYDLVERLRAVNINKVLLFGVPRKKDELAKCATDPDGVVQQAIRIFQGEDLTTVADVCLCQYTPTGECRIVEGGRINDEKSRNVISEISLSYAKAGVDYVAPSAVLSGQVKAIRETLNENSFSNTKIMSYSAKFASSFYGPFRSAVESSYIGGSRSYQLPFDDIQAALNTISSDVADGADSVIIKPALPYLDVIVEAKKTVEVPVVAYQVSGEYSALKSLDNPQVISESLYSIKRAGADFIISYGAVEVMEHLNKLPPPEGGGIHEVT